MNQIKKFDLTYSYDTEMDSIHIRIKDDYVYMESLELEDGVILDFSNDGIPVSLEILDICDSADNGFFDDIENINVNIEITNSSISLTLLIEVLKDDEMFNQPYSTVTKNTPNIPEMKVLCSY